MIEWERFKDDFWRFHIYGIVGACVIGSAVILLVKWIAS